MHVSVSVAGSYEDFFVAVKRNDARTVSALVERGFDPNTRDPQGQVALILALQGENLAVAEALMARPDTQVGLVNPVGESALMMAALKGDLAGVQLLLERGAKVDQAGWSPLHYAATGPEPKVVQLLLDRGAEIDAASPNGSTPLMMAAQYGSEGSVQLLLNRGADPRRRNQLDLAAVDFARRAGRGALVKRLEQITR
jgi:hypothetical protein